MPTITGTKIGKKLIFLNQSDYSMSIEVSQAIANLRIVLGNYPELLQSAVAAVNRCPRVSQETKTVVVAQPHPQLAQYQPMPSPHSGDNMLALATGFGQMHLKQLATTELMIEALSTKSTQTHDEKNALLSQIAALQTKCTKIEEIARQAIHEKAKMNLEVGKLREKVLSAAEAKKLRDIVRANAQLRRELEASRRVPVYTPPLNPYVPAFQAVQPVAPVDAPAPADAPADIPDDNLLDKLADLVNQ